MKLSVLLFLIVLIIVISWAFDVKVATTPLFEDGSLRVTVDLCLPTQPCQLEFDPYANWTGGPYGMKY